MPDTPQSKPGRFARVAIPITLLNVVIRPFLNPLVLGKIQRADVDMEALRELLVQYQSILPVDDQEVILNNFLQLKAMKQTLKNRSLPPSDYLEEAKNYKVLARLTLEITKRASERARDDDLTGRMARDTGITEFTTDHPMSGLHRVYSTTSYSSDSTDDGTLPAAPSVNVDIYYSCASTDEEDNFSGSVSSIMTAPSSIAPLTDLSSLAPTSVSE